MTNNPTSTVDISLSTMNKNYNDSESDDDDDSDLYEPQPITTTEQQIDPTQLQWMPWMWFYAKQSAKKSYEACDSAGEKLAWFFGITKPKYYSEIQEYERMDQEEREEWKQSFQDVEHKNDVLDSIVTIPPSSTNVFTISNQDITDK
ncbi:unnamed protein product [Adineta steineri]|uniref:Uncharacterized protein n=1 Tax=Adineta steineri TaxID=433720 RepID=A0A814SBY3_9BILA|nr:unnamed protein product [Adineta steineri]